MRPKHRITHLMAGCSMSHNPCLLHVSRWNQTKKSKYLLNTFFQEMVSVILGRSYPTGGFLSAHFLLRFVWVWCCKLLTERVSVVTQYCITPRTCIRDILVCKVEGSGSSIFIYSLWSNKVSDEDNYAGIMCEQVRIKGVFLVVFIRLMLFEHAA